MCTFREGQDADIEGESEGCHGISCQHSLITEASAMHSLAQIFSVCAMLQAKNVIGLSDWSPLAMVATQATTPSQPEAPQTLDTQDDSVTMGWRQPRDGGTPITDYQLECDDGRGGEFMKVFTGLALRHTVRRLQVKGLALSVASVRPSPVACIPGALKLTWAGSVDGNAVITD